MSCSLPHPDLTLPEKDFMVPFHAFALHLPPIPIELSDLTVTDPYIFIKKGGHNMRAVRCDPLPERRYIP